MNQKEAFKILSSGHNVLLTGAAGSGKTYLLNKYINSLKEQGIAVAVTASTGIAATHLGGRTIHSWSGIGIKDSLSPLDLRSLSKKSYLKKQFENTEVLVIDEVSMLSAHHLDMINKVCQTMKRNQLPFGGLQIVLSGDFFQLPPISRNTQEIKFVNQAEIWPEMDIRVCYLSGQYRQSDKKLSLLLEDLRLNKLDKKTLEQLVTPRDKKESKKFTNSKVTRLYTHNIDVDHINQLELEKIEAEEKIYQMTAQGEDQLVKALEKNCLAPQRLALKKGALVMFVKNKFINDEAVYVNGSIGLVIGFNANSYPRVRLHNGNIIDVMPDSWQISDNDEVEVLAKINQLPLRLAWAITIHKSQGMTLDEAVIDLSQSFSYGMGYVALSRLKSLNGLHLLGINEIACQVNPQVLKYNQELVALSEIAKKNKKSTWRKQQSRLDVFK